jgi:3-oxoacyl-[acyl-carrier-protein] synthase II
VLFPTRRISEPPPRVVVTGAGIATALGLGWKENAAGFREGKTAFSPVTLFDVSKQRAKIAAQVTLPDSLPPSGLSARRVQRLERAARLLLLAAHEAWDQSGWEPRENIPIVLGTTSGGMCLGEAYYRHALAQPTAPAHQAARVTHYLSHQQPLDLSDALGISGPITLIANACASGANAVGHAWELIRRGHADRVITGGYDGLSHMVFSGFDSLQALSTTRCRPFDAHRDGLALGEGAAVLTLETLDSAQKRNAEILGEIAGYGAWTDCHHLTQPQPQGDAALAAMTRAASAAGIEASQVGYVNAHGTGTPLNDAAEAHAINRWAGSHAKNISVSSTKSGIGHLLGAAGAVETIVCLMALRGQWLPPNAPIETPDSICQFPVVQSPTDAAFQYALTNSFGFGGANASLVLRRFA